MTAEHSFPTARQIALANVVIDIEKASSAAGWDHAPSLYALVPTGELLESGMFPEDVAQQLRAGWDGSIDHFSAIIQEDVPEEELEALLAQLAWPDEVAGAALSVERVVVPPHVEQQAPNDPEEALEFIQNHPERVDVRLVVAVLRTGETWSAVRSRTHDSDDKVGQGSALAPALSNALAMTFAPIEEEAQ